MNTRENDPWTRETCSMPQKNLSSATVLPTGRSCFCWLLFERVLCYLFGGLGKYEEIARNLTRLTAQEVDYKVITWFVGLLDFDLAILSLAS